MKTSKIAFLATALMILFVNATLAFSVKGSGNNIIEKRPIAGIERVSIQDSGVLYIQQGETESLEIEADDNILQRITTKVSGKTLTISHKMFFSLKPSKPIIYRLSVKKLSYLDTAGSVSVHSGHLKTKHFAIDISGSAEVEIENLEGRSFELDISGSGEIAIKKGHVKTQDISMSGSAEYQSKNFRSEEISLDISGSGWLEVWATKKLDVSISGSATVSYNGTPRISSDISGSGNLQSLGKKQ